MTAPKVIDLMEALKASIEKRTCAGGTEAEPCKGPAVMRAGDRWYCVAHDPNGGR